MTERHIFAAVDSKHFAVGDLIRRHSTADFINIILEVVNDVERGLPVQRVRSVRYGHTNGGHFRLLSGKRSKWISSTYYGGDWEKVIEYTPYQNGTIKANILNSLKDVDTTWRPNCDE